MRSNQSILKEINPDYSLEGLMLKLKFHYFGHLMWRTNSLEKTLMLGKIEGRRKRAVTEDEMIGWHHRLNGHEFEQILEDRKAWLLQSMGLQERDRTEWPSNKKSTNSLTEWVLNTCLLTASILQIIACLRGDRHGSRHKSHFHGRKFHFIYKKREERLSTRNTVRKGSQVYSLRGQERHPWESGIWARTWRKWEHEPRKYVREKNPRKRPERELRA